MVEVIRINQSKSEEMSKAAEGLRLDLGEKQLAISVLSCVSLMRIPLTGPLYIVRYALSMQAYCAICTHAKAVNSG